ncbi:MAG: helix-turn-helix domain-containing protein [Candidatus Pacebacteria bacterium]|nr:helix-turn-helix domain-containing protein [Candidatus Paceibacterota bacterium]
MTQNTESLLKTLLDFGLSDKEAKVYLTALELGSTSVLKISQLSSLKRPTVYLVVESLLKKGLMSVEVKGFKKNYKAENPDRLETIFNERKQELLKSLPYFQEIYAQDKSSSFIKYYEGLSAIKLVYSDLLAEIKTGDDYLVIGNQEEWLSLDSKFFQKFIEKRAELKINLRLLFQDSTVAREHKKYERNFNEKIKILPKQTSLTTNLVITPRKVIIHQLKSPTLAIVIENQNVSRMNKEMFEIIWNSIE